MKIKEIKIIMRQNPNLNNNNNNNISTGSLNINIWFISLTYVYIFVYIQAVCLLLVWDSRPPNVYRLRHICIEPIRFRFSFITRYTPKEDSESGIQYQQLRPFILLRFRGIRILRNDFYPPDNHIHTLTRTYIRTRHRK